MYNDIDFDLILKKKKKKLLAKEIKDSTNFTKTILAPTFTTETTSRRTVDVYWGTPEIEFLTSLRLLGVRRGMMRRTASKHKSNLVIETWPMGIFPRVVYILCKLGIRDKN